ADTRGMSEARRRNSAEHRGRSWATRSCRARRTPAPPAGVDRPRTARSRWGLRAVRRLASAPRRSAPRWSKSTSQSACPLLDELGREFIGCCSHELVAEAPALAGFRPRSWRRTFTSLPPRVARGCDQALNTHDKRVGFATKKGTGPLPP